MDNEVRKNKQASYYLLYGTEQTKRATSPENWGGVGRCVLSSRWRQGKELQHITPYH